jgi:hypothetical protein
MEARKYLFATIFIFLLGLSNALWGSTVGITIFMDNYYGVSETTIKGNLPDSIYYLFYFVFSIICLFSKKLIPSILLSFILTLAGVFIRIYFYIPNAVDCADCSNFESLTRSFSGFDGVITGNALIAAAQPFCFGFITMVTAECIDSKWKGTYIGATSTFSSLGYAIGYLASIYLVTSTSDFEKQFSNINYVYLAIVLFFFLLLLPVVAKGINNSPAATGNNNSSAAAGNNNSSAIEDVIDILEETETITNAITNKENDIRKAKICVLVYVIVSSINNVVSNYIENILQHKSENDEQTIFIASCLFLIPGIPFPSLIGVVIDKTKKCREILGYILLLQVVSQTIFLFVDTGDGGIWVIYAALTINSITSACLTSSMLTMIHQLVFPQSDQVYNNLIFSLSLLTTWIMMLFPTSDYDLIWGIYTVLTFVGVIVYYTFFFLKL